MVQRETVDHFIRHEKARQLVHLVRGDFHHENPLDRAHRMLGVA